MKKVLIIVLWLFGFSFISSPTRAIDCEVDRCHIKGYDFNQREETVDECREAHAIYSLKMDQLLDCEAQRLNHSCCVVNDEYSWSEGDRQAERFWGDRNGPVMVFWHERAELNWDLIRPLLCQECLVQDFDFFILDFMLANCQLRLWACGSSEDFTL